MIKPDRQSHSLASLHEENALLYEEVLVARRASEITAELVVEQFVKMEELLRRLEENVATEHELRTSLAEKLGEAESRKQELAESKVAAEAANEAKSLFLANMSHELRTPLNAIIGYSEMLIEDAEDLEQDDFIPDLQRICSAGKHLLELINGILDLSKIEAGKMELYLETFDVSEMLEDTVLTIRPLVGKNTNTLDVHYGENLGSMHADLTKVRQMLFNLLSNACKFTEHGHIHLSATRERQVFQQETESDGLVFKVSDTGIGMTKEEVGRLFQAFTQADISTTRKFGGTGLGLVVSKQFCQMMGGTIQVQSEHGIGTTFTIFFPAIVTEPIRD